MIWLHSERRELITPNQDVTIVNNPGEPAMGILVNSGQETETLNAGALKVSFASAKAVYVIG